MFAAGKGCPVEERCVHISDVVIDRGLDAAVPDVAPVTVRARNPELLTGLNVIEVCITALPTMEGSSMPIGGLPRLVETHLLIQAGPMSVL
jgi:hypothetical protein